MRVRNWFTASILLPGLSLLAFPVFAQQQSSDPVADAARKAREQQKNAPKPKKVYTDDDIKPSGASTQAAATTDQGNAGTQATPDKGQGAKGPAAGTAPQKADDAETMWRKRFAAQRKKIADAERELDILQRESEKAQVQYYSDPQKALQEQNSRKDINEKNTKIELKKQEITNLKQQLSDMEDELRKAGGDPGWASE
jgi:chromosome segregation ATPase